MLWVCGSSDLPDPRGHIGVLVEPVAGLPALCQGDCASNVVGHRPDSHVRHELKGAHSEVIRAILCSGSASHHNPR